MMGEKGLCHLYCGDGKGKTTAAMGLALRAAGSGMQVLIVQFLKNRETGELRALSAIPNIRILRGKGGSGFSFSMSEEEKSKTRQIHQQNFDLAVCAARMGECDLLILDEAVGACRLGLLDEKSLLDFLQNRPLGLEVVLTGRGPDEALCAAADYITEMKKIRHPFDAGVAARDGIER